MKLLFVAVMLLGAMPAFGQEPLQITEVPLTSLDEVVVPGRLVWPDTPYNWEQRAKEFAPQKAPVALEPYPGDGFDLKLGGRLTDRWSFGLDRYSSRIKTPAQAYIDDPVGWEPDRFTHYSKGYAFRLAYKAPPPKNLVSTR